MSAQQTSDRDSLLTRVYDAPPELVYELWTRPEHVDRWYGPRGFTTHTSAMDVRVGGEWRFEMRSAEHGNFLNRARYREVVPGQRLVWDYDAGEDNDPNALLVTVTFKDLGGRTEVTLHNHFFTAAALETAKGFGAIELGLQTLSHLDAVLDAQGAVDLVVRRTYAASRDRVWAAWTETAQLARWWGPIGIPLTVIAHEARPGGVFHFAMHPPGGVPPMYGRFLYREVVPQTRLAWLHAFSDAAGALARAPFSDSFPLECYNSVDFTEADGQTTVTLRSRPIRATEAERAFVLGMHEDMQQGYGATCEALAQFLAQTG